MRTVISAAAIVTIASLIQFDGISYSPLAASPREIGRDEQDRVAGIVSAMQSNGNREILVPAAAAREEA